MPLPSPPARRRVGAAIATVVVLMIGLVAVPATPAAAVVWGSRMVAASSWLGGQGVDAYSNAGGCASNCTSTLNGVYVGERWQCVELAQRLYTVRGWHKGSFGVPVAKQIYGRAPAIGLEQHANGSPYSPVPGDLVVQDEPGGAGHVSVVDRVDGAGIDVVEQNNDNTTGRGRYSWGGPGTMTTRPDDARPVVGFVHAPRNGGARAPATPDFAWTAVGQASYTDASKTTPKDTTALRPGEQAWLVVRARNTGTAAWRRDSANPVRLATIGPNDRSSAFATPSWISASRPANPDEDTVEPGGVATFEFAVVAPDVGQYDERFSLVAEGQSWFSDVGLDLHAVVSADGGSGRARSGTGRSGYWLVDATGIVSAFGDAPWFGSAPLLHGDRAASIASTAPGAGYWVVTRRGGVFAFGDAWAADTPPPALAASEAVTAIAGAPGGRGYWLFTNGGRALPYGTAVAAGDLSGHRLNAPITASAATPSGNGYYMAAGDGGVFTFGDAAFAGSTGGLRLNKPIVGMAPDPDGAGYWLVASDGGIFAFDAEFRGSTGDIALNQPVVGAVPSGNGYLLVASDGGIFNFSDRPFEGSLGDRPPSAPVVAVAPLAP